MNPKKMLVGILATALGWSVGLMIYDKILAGRGMTQVAPAEEPAAPAGVEE